MSILNSISGAAKAINIGGSALSLIGMGTSLIRNKDLKRGIDGFLFDVPLTENITMSSNITNHYIEDNTTLQDHVALNPISITLTGKVAELVYTKQASLSFLTAVADRLAPLGVLSPAQSGQAQKAIASANQALSAITSAKKALNSLSDVFTDNPSLNRQQTAYYKFESYFLGRARLSVETPWRTYTDMVIEQFAADQDQNSTEETTFTITFKQVKFVETKSNVGTLKGRIAEQASKILNKGVQTGSKDESFGVSALKGLGVVK
jgi:hypothetical protein